jgi:hypothetical protein
MCCYLNIEPLQQFTSVLTFLHNLTEVCVSLTFSSVTVGAEGPSPCIQVAKPGCKGWFLLSETVTVNCLSLDYVVTHYFILRTFGAIL